MRAPKVKVPGLSPAELALQRAQAGLLNDQRGILRAQQDQQRILLPFLAKQAGFKVKLDAKGNLIGIEEINDPLSQQAKKLQGLEQQRAIDALEGKLPVDPGLERELGSQEEVLRERLQRQFGAGYETSTAGQQTLDEFFRSSEGLRSDARTGQLTLAEQLGMARQGLGLQTQGQNLGILGGASDLSGIFQGAGALAQGYGQAQIPYLQNRQMGLQASIYNAQNAGSAMSGWGSLAGVLLGKVFSGGMGGGGATMPGLM